MKKCTKLNHGNATLGALMFFGALIIIGLCLINYFYNMVQMKQHPIATLFSGGRNLSSYGYNFLPPWTGFEIAVLVIGGIGFVILAASKQKEKK